VVKQLLENNSSEAAPAMSGSYAHFIDPEFGRRFVGVDVVNSRRESHDHTTIDRDDDVVPRIPQELAGRRPIQRAVKDVWPNHAENVVVARLEDPDLHCSCEVVNVLNGPVVEIPGAVQCIAVSGAETPWFDFLFGIELRVFEINRLELVSQTFASWNHIGQWLRQIDAFRQAA
jgi:hypothetical protein